MGAQADHPVLVKSEHHLWRVCKKRIGKHYAGFDLLQNTKFTVNDSVKVQTKC